MDTTFSKEAFAIRFQNGDEAGLEYFFHNFYPALVHFANSFLKDNQLAEEVASDAFIKTWKHHAILDNYGAIRAYLYKVVYRDATRLLSKHKRRYLLEISNELYTDEAIFEPLVRAETVRILREAIQQLAPATRTVIEKYYLDQKNIREIAEELNLSPSTVKTQKIRGINQLKSRFNLRLSHLARIFFLFSNFL